MVMGLGVPPNVPRVLLQHAHKAECSSMNNYKYHLEVSFRYLTFCLSKQLQGIYEQTLVIS